MTATDELRRLLDERGVEWRDDSSIYGTRRTVWTADGVTYVAAEVSGRLKVSGYLTPEQAIAATLGRGECRADETETIKALYNDNHYIKNVIVHIMECSECGHTYEHVNGDYEYCPNCGRRIVEVDDGHAQ